MKYVVLDADVMVAGFAGKAGAAHHLLRAVAEGRLVPLTSTPLLLDYEFALKQAEARLAHGLSREEIDSALAAFASAAAPVDVTFLWRPQMNDPADELVLEAAVNGNAEAIVSRRAQHFALAGQMFGFETLTPQDFMARINA